MLQLQEQNSFCTWSVEHGYFEDIKNEVQTSPFVMEKLTTLEAQDRSFDIEFWQRQTSTARFAAAWEMVEFAHKLKGRDVTEF